MLVITTEEKAGLEQMQILTKEYIKRDDADKVVSEFLQKADEETMVTFLRGRKHQALFAWETLKRHAEVKLIKYPEMFLETLPPEIASISTSQSLGILKSRDKYGRRIVVFNSSKWDLNRHSLIDIFKYITPLADNLIRDEDCAKNGLVYIQDCSEMGIRHCMQYSLKTIQRAIAIYYRAIPLKYKGVYYVNTPSMMQYALTLLKMCIPRKLAERMHVWSGPESYDQLHKIFQKEILPKFLKGNLEYEEAIDYDLNFPKNL